ncbi:MAG: hypothetical protein KF838_10455 [Phycisphaeraceae bacterium]|nr:MAG: hypothetical protein KF838_10455 [Phycisphaeraceae bacterium]
MSDVASERDARAGASGGISGGGAGVDERVSVLVGDRLCVSCGFNLAGQTVVREPHYRMLIVRCPECATAASLQEYPVLGKWANRWGGVLAAVMILVTLLLALGTAGTIFGMSYAVSRVASKPLTDLIAKEHSAWAKASRETQNVQQVEKAREALAVAKAEEVEAILAAEAAPDSETLRARADASVHATSQAEQRLVNVQATIDQQVQWQTYYDTSWVSVVWLDQQDTGDLIARARAEGSKHLATAFSLWTLLAIIVFALGVLWGVVMLHARAKRMALVCVVILAIAAVFAAIQRAGGGMSTTIMGATQMELTSDVATRMLGVLPLALSAGLAGIPLFFGMISGRPLARLYVRLVLPPRLRGPLATLWIADGLSPPSAR